MNEYIQGGRRIKKYLQNKYAPETHSDTKGNIFVNEKLQQYTFSCECLMFCVLTMVENTMTVIEIALKLQVNDTLSLCMFLHLFANLSNLDINTMQCFLC